MTKNHNHEIKPDTPINPLLQSVLDKVDDSNYPFTASVNDLYKSHHIILNIVLRLNRKEGLNIDKDEMEYLVHNSDMRALVDGLYGSNTLLTVYTNYMTQRLSVTSDLFDYIVKNSDLNHVNRENYNILIKILLFNKGLEVKPETMDYIYNNIDLDKTINLLDKIVVPRLGGFAQKKETVLEKLLVLKEKQLIEAEIANSKTNECKKSGIKL